MIFEQLKIAYHRFRLKRIPANYDQILSKYNEYYVDLNDNLKKIFRERVYISIQFINFEGVEIEHVTDEMKVLITSALVQITFGLDKYIMSRFKTIYVLPNTYSFQEYPALLGHVDHDNDVIAMSWPSVKDGFIIPDDAMNVALHEIAHAIQGEHLTSRLFQQFFEKYEMHRWEKEAVKELYKIREKRHDYLSEYAGQNLFELFAVSVECFFEQSEIFHEKVPKLYQLMVELLGQDPMQKQNPMQHHI